MPFGIISGPYAGDLGDRGVALISAAHPLGTGDVKTVRFSPGSIERIEIDLPIGPLPEVEFVYSGAEFNEEFGPLALVKLARERGEARVRQKCNDRARYRRMCRRRMRTTS